MAKSRPSHHLAPTAPSARHIVLGQDLTTFEGEAAARDILYERLLQRAHWIDACETLARRFKGWPPDDPRDVPDADFLIASHSLIWAGGDPPVWSDPEWFPPEVHAHLARQDAVAGARAGRAARRLPRPSRARISRGA